MIMAVMSTVGMVVVVPTHFGNVVHPDIMSRSSGAQCLLSTHCGH